jgi:hypothetical protein
MSARNDHGRKSTLRERKEIVRAGLTTIGIRDRSIKNVRSAGHIGWKQGARFTSDGMNGKILRARFAGCGKGLAAAPDRVQTIGNQSACQNA